MTFVEAILVIQYWDHFMAVSFLPRLH